MSSELMKIENGAAVLLEEVENNLIGWQQSIKALQECVDEVKAQIMRDMELNGVIKIETEHLLINYIAETEKETFQSKKFKTEQRELYDEYCKLTKVAPQVRIKVKE